MTSNTIDAAFIDRWSARYKPEWDAVVLDEIGPKVRRQGHYTDEDARDVVRWKSRRALGRLKLNGPGDIEYVTRAALNGPPHLAHLLLGTLHGVATPVASSILMIFSPDEFTVIDRYAIRTLRAHGEWTDRKKWPQYPEYVGICEGLRERCGCTLRTLDRALWAWGEANGG
ncbi:hypothetical protein [Pseudonocardia endophytica]|uniref:Uncharacterized protein n=1 Tax=Pseudonocardia endophytica TaxID=401976 RepID=A0A4R1HTR9_PSEEN|nr:hypothetical protein [Pseudonocardia endophytica]TCK25628.1 hypothetical protein EV378_1444 [Pseudonocardia endophytica]